MASEPATRTILLTGANGQVGHELTRSLSVLGNLVATTRDELDLADVDRIREVVRRVRPALIVNAGAYTAVDRAEKEAGLADQVNGVAPGVLAEEVGRLGGAMVHYSTDYVFDGSGNRPWREDDAPNPINAYGASKLAGERAVVAAGCPHLILRTSWVYGLHGQNFVKTMLRLGRDRRELSVVADQVGAPTSARVIADVTACLLAPGDWPGMFRRRGGILHLACRGYTSWHGFAEEVFRLARARQAPVAVRKVHPVTSTQCKTGARRPLNSRLDCTRLLQRFGLAPPPWRTALAQSQPIV